MSTIDTDLIKDNLDLVDLQEKGGLLEDLAVKQNFFGIFINYFNLVKIEYLSGFIFDFYAGIVTIAYVYFNYFFFQILF